jgi:hypothetical protein
MKRGSSVNLVLSLLAACGGPSAGGERASTPSPPAVGEASSQPKEAGDPSFPPLDALSARAPSIAPGMREIARHDGGPEVTEVAHAGDKDLCVRLLFVANAPVAAALMDHSGAVLSEAPEGTGGALGENGPVCVRRGQTVRVRFESRSPAPRVRWIAWAPK